MVSYARFRQETRFLLSTGFPYGRLLLARQSAHETSPQQTLGLCLMGLSGQKRYTRVTTSFTAGENSLGVSPPWEAGKVVRKPGTNFSRSLLASVHADSAVYAFTAINRSRVTCCLLSNLQMRG